MAPTAPPPLTPEQYVGFDVSDAKSILGRFMVESSQDVLPIRLTAAAAQLFRSMTGRPIGHRTTIIVIAGLPLSMNTVFLFFGRGCTGLDLYWIVYNTIANFFVLAFPVYAWRSLILVSDDIDAMIPTVSQKNDFVDSIRHFFAWPIQLKIALVSTIVWLLTILGMDKQVASPFTFCAASYLSLILPGSLATVNAYWLWQGPLLVKRITQVSDPVVYWNSPITTPGIRNLSRLLSRSAIMAMIAMVVLVTPPLYALYSLSSRAILTFNIVWGLIGFATVGFIAIMPQYWLSSLARREKYKLLDSLASQLLGVKLTPSTLANPDELQQINTTVSLFAAIKASSSWTISTATLLQLIVTDLAVFPPFAFQWFAPRLALYLAILREG